MDDTRLIVDVEKQKVIYDPKNVMYKDLQAKEKAWDAVDWSFDNTRSDKRINTYSNTPHVATPNKSMMWVTYLKVCGSCVC